MSPPIRPTHLIPGHPHHGVVRYAGEIAEVTRCAVWRDLQHAQLAEPRRLHLHFTDRLWAPDPAAAAERVTALARRHPLTVTLHDLPQPSDGPDGHRRRADCYRRVIAAARGVVCNSHSEVGLVAALAPAPVAARCAVIPLPVEAAATGAEPPPPRSEIGLIGFVYPGKGHRQAIDAAAVLAARSGSPPLAVVALGGVSAGHAAEAQALVAHARRRGVAFTITGYLTEAVLYQRARQVLAPVAAHRHLSASGSIGSWLTAGRRPLVADSGYAQEIEHLRPGTIRRYDPDQLAQAIAGALADPVTTWLEPGTQLGPDRDQVGTAYLDWWTREAAR